MIPLLGRSLILLALLAAAAGAVVGFAAGASATGARWTRRLAYAFAAFLIAANFVMVYALVTHDFSVGYVSHVGSRLVPTWVSVVSLWSSLEGSILFWGLVLGVYVVGALHVNRSRHPEYMPYATAVWLACGAFFAFLLAGPAQPFGTVQPVPPDGPGPNPLLQNHILMVAHPPFLYAGYVGMTIPFGLACAALLRGRLGHDFLRPLRTWLLLPWTFQTVAIMLGGWWAYEVLGWGGYWAWDPVENASLLPWLTATAALHSALLTERKGVLKGWTVTLVMATFLLTILGTFMTRSGVFNSVHSFTQSAIGPTILAFLAAALLFSVGLLATRIERLTPEGHIEGGGSRDGMFLVNNLLLVLFTFTVLIGTVFPLVVEAVRGVQMSVGRPYFDRMAVPLGAALLLLMGVGPALPWGRASTAQMRKALLSPMPAALVFAGVGYALGVHGAWTLLTLAFGGFTAHVTLREMFLPLRHRVAGRHEDIGSAVRETVAGGGRRRFAAYVVHAGAVLVIIAIAVSSTMGISTELQVTQGQSFTLGAYTFTLQNTERVSEPHREGVVATIAVAKNGKNLGVLRPRMNQYDAQREPIGTPDVRSGLFSDLYVSLMSIDPDKGAIGVLALVNPMVPWIWGSTLLMALGGLLALAPRPRAGIFAVRSATVSSPSGVASKVP